MGEATDRLVALSYDGLTDDDADLILSLAGKLDWSPKKNWVEEEGGLPPGIESMAIHMMKESGLSRSHAIAASVTRAKVLAAKGQARWVKEVAQWESMKMKRKAKKAAKD